MSSIVRLYSFAKRLFPCLSLSIDLHKQCKQCMSQHVYIKTDRYLKFLYQQHRGVHYKMSATIPENVKDLLENPITVSFATTNPDGQPQVTPVWCSLEGDQVWINSARGRRKDKNVRAQPKVTVLALDPTNPFHWVEIRGEIVEFDESEAAVNHINKLSGMYTGNSDYYRNNPDGKNTEQRVIYKIQPNKVNGQ